MKRTGFTDEQISSILAEHQAGANCTDLCRKQGMTEGTFYNWKASFCGMTVSEAKRLKVLGTHAPMLVEARTYARSPQDFVNFATLLAGELVIQESNLFRSRQGPPALAHD